MWHAGEVLQVNAACSTTARDDLAALYATVQQLKEDLLDYNPLLAIMAEALQQAVALEIESQRCNLLLATDSA